jgi:hypothetical protein
MMPEDTLMSINGLSKVLEARQHMKLNKRHMSQVIMHSSNVCKPRIAPAKQPNFWDVGQTFGYCTNVSTQ